MSRKTSASPASSGFTPGEAFVRWFSGLFLGLACWSVIPVVIGARLKLPVGPGLFLVPLAWLEVGVSEVIINYRVKRRGS